MKIIIFLLLVTASTSMFKSTDLFNEQTTFQQETESCYTGYSGRDTVVLSVNMDNNNVRGSLSYKFHEKDANEGTISGQMKGDTLIADYIFMSEGMPSVRQVVFLKKDNMLIEGHGAMEEKEGKLTFKDPGSLHFGNSFVLQKVRCYNP